MRYGSRGWRLLGKLRAGFTDSGDAALGQLCVGIEFSRSDLNYIYCRLLTSSSNAGCSAPCRGRIGVVVFA